MMKDIKHLDTIVHFLDVESFNQLDIQKKLGVDKDTAKKLVFLIKKHREIYVKGKDIGNTFRYYVSPYLKIYIKENMKNGGMWKTFD